MNKVLIIANWKCNPSSLKGAKLLFGQVKKGMKKIKNTEVVICPPFVYIPFFGRQSGRSNLTLGAQDVFWKEGAFTGEVSGKMLRDLDCKYVIVGHSERRALGETNETINKKIKSCFNAKLVPIFCVGESLEERKAGKAPLIIKNQIKEGLKGISRKAIGNLIIAYEPIWAISTGQFCNFDEAMTMCLLIRKNLTDIYNRRISKNIRVIYGGSVKADNVLGYIKEANMDGVLAGGASVDAREFIALLGNF